MHSSETTASFLLKVNMFSILLHICSLVITRISKGVKFKGIDNRGDKYNLKCLHDHLLGYY